MARKEIMLRSLEDFETTKGRKLGSGSFATVRLVTKKSTGEEFALKEIDLSHSRNVAFESENLKREIKNHKQMNHPNIIKFYDSLRIGNKVYILLEYAPNGNLFQYLAKRGKLDEATAVSFFAQTAEALDYTHKKNVIHRDMKPENLLLAMGNQIKLCDFGWCAEFVGQRKTFCGTYEYMAPEIFEKRPYGKEVDIWGLGILLYELLHGVSPFKSQNLNEIYEKIKMNSLSFAPFVGQAARNLITEILNLDPSARPSIPAILNHQLIKRYTCSTIPSPNCWQLKMELGRSNTSSRTRYPNSHLNSPVSKDPRVPRGFSISNQPRLPKYNGNTLEGGIPQSQAKRRGIFDKENSCQTPLYPEPLQKFKEQIELNFLVAREKPKNILQCSSGDKNSRWESPRKTPKQPKTRSMTSFQDEEEGDGTLLGFFDSLLTKLAKSFK